jgi:hypothetical protein
MSDSQEPEEARNAPLIDHVPAQDEVPPAEHSATAASGRVPPEPPPPTVVTRRGGTPFLLTLLLFAGLGGAIYYTWTHPHDAPPAPVDPQPAIEAAHADVLQKLQALSDRIDKLQKQQDAASAAPPPAPAQAPAPPAPNTDALNDISKRLDELAGHLNEVSAQQAQEEAALQKLQASPAEAASPGPAPEAPPQAAAGAEAQQQLADLGSKLDQALSQEKASLDALSQRLGKLEQGTAAETEAQDNKQAIQSVAAEVKKLAQGESQLAGVKQDATLAVKLSAAQAALSAGQPLGVLPGAPPALARFATSAPPTEASLRASFPQVAQAALAASRPEETQSTFFDRALARLEQTVTVRRGDHVIVGDPAAGVIAKAQQELNDDDLKAAVATLSALSGRAAKAVQPWVAQANAVLEARAALAQLAAHG